MPTVEQLNSFAQKLVEQIASRATGEDDESARIVEARPSDRILAGYLTPVREDPREGDIQGNEDERLATDLPNDAAYEQTNLGMYWLVPDAALAEGRQLQGTLRLSVYVRRLPTREEQSRATWRLPLSVTRDRANDRDPLQPREAEAVSVWTREDLGQIPIEPIDLAGC